MPHPHSCLAFAVLFALSLIHTGCGGSGNSNYDAADEAYQAGKYERAIELFTLAAEESDDPAIWGNRGNCYSSLGDLDAALKDYNTAIEKANKITGDPNDSRLAYLYYNRGAAYESAHRYAEAVEDYEKTASLDNKYPDAKGRHAWIIATCRDKDLRDPGLAATLATAECEQTGWKNAGPIDTLAAAHAAAGDFTQAVERQNQAIKLLDNADEEKDFQERLTLYRKKKPYFQPVTE